MKDHRRSSHSISSITAHIVWVTKYRYPVLRGDIQKRCRELLIQLCDAEGYSFGDAHINESIKNLLISSPETQITIIDPYFRENRIDEKISLELLSNSNLSLSPTNLTGKSCSFLDGKIIVHEDFFDEYLENVI